MLPLRSVVEKHDQEAHLQSPQRYGQQLLQVPGKFLGCDRVTKYLGGTAADFGGSLPQAGEWVIWFAGVAEDNPEEFAIVFGQVELCIHGHREAIAQNGAAGEGLRT